MRIIDQSLHGEVALPAAAGSANTDPVNLKVDEAGPVGRGTEVHIALPAATVADAATLTVDFQDCATEDGTFVNVPTTGNMVATGADAAGTPATNFRFYLPPHTRRWVRAKVTASGAGDNSGVAMQMDFKV